MKLAKKIQKNKQNHTKKQSKEIYKKLNKQTKQKGYKRNKLQKLDKEEMRSDSIKKKSYRLFVYIIRYIYRKSTKIEKIQ